MDNYEMATEIDNRSLDLYYISYRLYQKQPILINSNRYESVTEVLSHMNKCKLN